MTRAALLPIDVPTETQRVVRCADCRRRLYTPESRLAGRGPGCGHQEAGRRYEVEQDGLFDVSAAS